jgi:hypothetical protein
MKYFIMSVMLAALYLLYCIAFPKQSAKGENIPETDTKTTRNIMGKTCYCLPKVGKPQKTPTSNSDFENPIEKPLTFAPSIEKTVISKNEFDEVFSENPNPKDLDIEPDDDDDFEAEATAAEISRIANDGETTLAAGLDFDDLQTFAKAVDEHCGQHRFPDSCWSDYFMDMSICFESMPKRWKVSREGHLVEEYIEKSKYIHWTYEEWFCYEETFACGIVPATGSYGRIK